MNSNPGCEQHHVVWGPRAAPSSNKSEFAARPSALGRLASEAGQLGDAGATLPQPIGRSAKCLTRQTREP